MRSVELNRAHTIRGSFTPLSSLKPGSEFTLSGLFGSSKAFFLASFFKTFKRQVLAVLPGQEAAEDFSADLRFFLPEEDVFFYPSPEILPFESLSAHQEIQAKRIELLFRLCDGRPFITVSSAPNLMQRVMPREGLIRMAVNLKVGEEYPRDELFAKLHGLGYSKMSMVEERGEMSVRGGILDIFPPMFESPVRIEFFGDGVESIRTFDISTQRSLKELKEAAILPAKEANFSRGSAEARDKLIERADTLGIARDVWEGISDKLRDGSFSGIDMLLPLFYEKCDTLFDYLKPGAIISIIDPESAGGSLEKFDSEIRSAVERLISKKQFFVEPTGLYMSSADVKSALKGYPVINIETLRSSSFEILTESNIGLRQSIELQKNEEFQSKFEQSGHEEGAGSGSGVSLLKPLAGLVNERLREGFKVYLTAHNKGQAERTRELLEGYGFKPSIIRGSEILERRESGEFAIAIGSVQTGFKVPGEALVIISEEEVFGERIKRRAPPSKKLDAFLTQLQDLSVGDAIVHSHHGIGLYRGLKRLGVDGVESDFLLLEYRGGDKLYLPVWRMDLVSKYHGVEGKAPELDKLGGAGWEKTKKRVRHAVEKLAGELLKLYAERQVAEGFAFSKPDRIFLEFEAGFEYEETPDQARAIEECLGDMEEPRPMDRLICGDVGYGKTEVAIRAAFKAVLDRKQVAVLVPTTVLAQQHFSTFNKRLAPYPVMVEVLSRFRSKKEQKETVEKLKKGAVDIVIGTHRLLQKDIEFKDLGLIVIDEEHRFGVAHKEKLKHLRKRVDVLTLTATPIPRTLHMSLASIRELSIINTPPEDRLAIKTGIIRFDESLIAEAIERELGRGGQVFFVHNRVQSIGAMEEFLTKTVPGARVAVAHGQMNEHELEKKMLGFVNRDYDILLSTAIIESGLDIPSANTIIINRADRFGLAELYQLRGRVGRSAHRAYAYFICPDGDLTEDARKRLEVIQELCEPGSGFKVAAYDLEIRGAGELLGTSQSGQIAEVGFDMYAQLLEEAVREMKGEEVAEEAEPEINLKISQYIPEEYVPDTRQRLGLYKRLASVSSEDDIISLTGEFEDRYGEIPALVENLIHTMELKLFLKKLRAKELTQKGTRLYITFGSHAETEEGGEIIGRALQMVKKEPARFRITPDSRLIVFMKPDSTPLEEARYVLKGLLNG